MSDDDGSVPQTDPDEPAVEGGADADGEPEERRYPSTIGGAFYIAIMGVVGAGIAVAVLSDWRVGVRIMAGGLAVAGLLRLVLPQRDAGMLAVRPRAVDVALFVSVALALVLLAGTIPDQPGR